MKHVEDVSLSILFLLEAAKKTDRAFQVTTRSSSHTVHSSQMDTEKMTKHLLEMKTTTEVKGRDTPAFADATDTGYQKLSTTSWLTDRLLASDLNEELEEEDMNGELDLDYELADVV